MVHVRSLIVSLACLFVFGAFLPTHAQISAPIVFYLGRTDSNNDGLVDLSDVQELYVSTDGAETRTLSQIGMPVTQFDVSENLQRVAYVTADSSGTIVDLIDVETATSTRITAGDLTGVRVDLFDSLLWITGLNADLIPVIRGYDLITTALVNERVFRRSNTSVAFYKTGEYVLAYNNETGGLSVFSLPELELVQFQIEGYAATAPQWSPTEPKFVIGVSNEQPHLNVGIYLVDVTTAQSRLIDTVANPGGGSSILRWSDHGHYILSTPQAVTDATSTTLIDVQTGSMSALAQSFASTLTIVNWSINDEYALLSDSISQDLQTPQTDSVQFFQPATNAIFNPSSIDNLIVSNAEWSPNTNQLAIIGQSQSDGVFGLFILDVASDTLTNVLESFDPDLASGFYYWNNAGTHLVYSGASFDAIITNLGNPLALYVTDLMGNSVRLSPEGMQIDPASLQVR